MKLCRGFIKTNYQEIIIAFLFICLFLFSLLNSISPNNFFSVANALIFLLCIFIFGGKYRFLSIFLFTPFAKFFSLQNFSFGSLYTYCILIYVFVESIILLKKGTFLIKGSAFPLLIFLSFYIILISTINSGIHGFVKGVSPVIYLCFFYIAYLEKDKIDFKKSFVSIVIGLLLSCAIGATIIYIFKGDIAVNFLTRYYSKTYVTTYKANNGS